MKLLVCGLAISGGIVAGTARAEVMLDINGTEYALSTLMENCQNLSDPTSQIACFNAVSDLVEEQSGEPVENAVSPSDALEALRALAQYEDDFFSHVRTLYSKGQFYIGLMFLIRLIFRRKYVLVAKKLGKL